jgi:hypothetical protein
MRFLSSVVRMQIKKKLAQCNSRIRRVTGTKDRLYSKGRNKISYRNHKQSDKAA